MLNEPGQTIASKDYVPYQKSIEFTNIDFAVCGLLDKMANRIPVQFIHFYPSMKELFFKNYDKEMSKIQKKLMDVPDYAYLKDIANKDTNFEGSFINHILCVHENEVLGLMREWCALNDVSIHSLMFDGLMVYEDVNDSTLLDMKNTFIITVFSLILHCLLNLMNTAFTYQMTILKK